MKKVIEVLTYAIVSLMLIWIGVLVANNIINVWR